MPKLSVYYSADEMAKIEAAAGKDESAYAYVKRTALAHANGEWKANGATELIDVVGRLQEATAREPAKSSSEGLDPELRRQVGQIASAINLLAKVVVQLQADQQRMLESNQQLVNAISEAL